ncbi:hypothetical protein M9H77_22768 [Catharanthus roseus]|uniref:Uncharacterized protein n=1 Tax=Catharanthus roseus TaxID=4058 RepID=A0ACC0ARD4_CATRO|nr:hypothetical protein M9H77_22768 [Catharanthus roseus]
MPSLRTDLMNMSLLLQLPSSSTNFAHQMTASKKSQKPVMYTVKPPFVFLKRRPFTFVFVHQILFSSNQARFCLNLHGRRSGSQATTFVDPTKSLNLAAAHSLISDSPDTRSMNNLSKICSLISDSPATRSMDPTLFSNLVARLIGT